MANAPKRRDFLIIVKFAQNRACRLAERIKKTVQIKRKERTTFKGILEVDEVGRA